MDILVTGASGFIGSHLVPELRRFGHSVVGTDITDGDLRHAEVAFGQVGSCEPDVVVHLAAQVGRVFGEDDLERSISTNALASAHVAQACAAYGARLVYCSTSEVYGDQGEIMCWEGGPEIVPHGIYGLSKRWGEEAARLYAPKDLQIVRLSMPYGPGLPAGRGRAALINFLWQAHKGIPMTVHRGGKRSWCWIGDTIRGFRFAIEGGERAIDAVQSQSGTGVYNIGRDDNETPMVEVARMACQEVGASEDLIVEVDPPANQTVVKKLATGKLVALGWKPEIDLREGMHRTWEVMRETYNDEGMPT